MVLMISCLSARLHPTRKWIGFLVCGSADSGVVLEMIIRTNGRHQRFVDGPGLGLRRSAVPPLIGIFPSKSGGFAGRQNVEETHGRQQLLPGRISRHDAT